MWKVMLREAVIWDSIGARIWNGLLMFAYLNVPIL